MTPIHVAAAFNNSAVVEILASNGGILESTTFYMLQTPLHYAARYNSPSSVKKLVEMGAQLEARYTQHSILCSSLCRAISKQKYLNSSFFSDWIWNHSFNTEISQGLPR